MIKSIIFFGTSSCPADVDFNEWISNNNIEIIQCNYQQGRYGDHSIFVLYKERNQND